MIKIDFNKTKPTFDNGQTKWYLDSYFQKYINNEQANNLPKLENLGCFIVKGDDVKDFVLIDNKQNIVASYHYSNEGFGQMEAIINIIKIAKYYERVERNEI